MSLVLTTAALVLVYLAALGSAGAADVGTGVLLALLAQWSVRAHAPVRHGLPAALLSRALWLAPFVAVLVARSLSNAVSFVPYLVRPSALKHAGLVEIPYGERSERGVAVTALCISLSPGSVALDMDADRRVLIVQVADARDADRVLADEARFYDRWQRRVAP